MNHYILCPYYKSHRNYSITCEDAIHYFSKDGVEKQFEKYCDSDWHSCKYAQALEALYTNTPPDKFKEEHIKLEAESLRKEIQKLISKIGILEKRVELMTRIAKDNQEMYQNSLEQKQKVADAYAAQARWTESLASAFLTVAYGLGTKVDVVEISKDEISRLMQAYKLQITQTEDGKVFRFKVEKKTE